ncbi:polyprenyl diphosphate synthase [Methanocella arvoryzae]|nr:polyprenyl diphosphate synthase [Methanocella arvoryzae]
MQLKGILRNMLFSRWYEHIPVIYKWYELSMKREILKGPIPQHIAIIMDGNRRYAKRMGEVVEKGHMLGADTTERVIQWCEQLRVRQLTLYSFSTENFQRNEREKKAIFNLIKDKLRKSRESPETHKYKIRINCIGDMDMLPDDMREEIRETHNATGKYDNFFLNVALAYGGRKEIVDGAARIAEKVKAREMNPEEITEDTIDQYLYFDKKQKSSVDLIIRTGGDERTSNFLPWQASGNECAIYISAPYWPEFRKIDFYRAIRAYQNRDRDHKVKYALRVIKIKKRAGQFRKTEVVDCLKSGLSLTAEEADSILKDPHVVRAMKGAAA